MTTPDWVQDAIFYQIFPDRFARNMRNPSGSLPFESWDSPPTPYGFKGGDLYGITEKLDYLKDLGVTALYLNPIFASASNHRYHAYDYYRVDPLLGGDKALARLAQEVHARGWRLVGDLTANHCGDTHPWFRRAREEPGSAERDFFYFAGPNDNAYEGWLGIATLPKFRHSSPELRRRLLDGQDSVAGRWLRPPYELDGWRVDVANMTGRLAADDFNASVARSLRKTIAAVRTDGLLLAEHCHDASGDLAGDGWQGAMNYAGFTRPVWTWLRHPELSLSFLGLPMEVPRLGADALVSTVRAFTAAVPWRSMAVSWSLLGSHDSARIRTVVADSEAGEVAAGMLFSMPGAPMVFAGDEIGLEGVLGEDARRPFPWHRPERWDRVTLGRYRGLAELRRSHDALRRGGLRWVHAEGDALAFLRESEQERLLVLATRAAHQPVRLPAGTLGLGAEAPNVYGGGTPLRAGTDGLLTLPGDGPTFQVWQLA